jgi:hypothetical protein
MKALFMAFIIVAVITPWVLVAFCVWRNRTKERRLKDRMKRRFLLALGQSTSIPASKFHVLEENCIEQRRDASATCEIKA